MQIQDNPRDKLDLEYLHSSAIGGVISEGLTVLYKEKPSKPVDFLAKWLLSYSRTQNNEKLFITSQKQKDQLYQKHFDNLLRQEVNQGEVSRVAQEKLNIEKNYRETIQNHQYHQELLQKDFCNFLQQQKGLTGVYIVSLDYQKQIVDLDEVDDEKAHLNMKDKRLLHYIGASTEDEFLINRVLLPEQGITYTVLQDQQNEDGSLYNNGIYIPDVVKDNRIFFHKWPKLGAYFAYPLHYQSCLQEQYFDKGFGERCQYLNLMEERLNKINEFEVQIQLKREQNEDYSIIEEEYQTFQQSLDDLVEPVFQSEKRSFILCADTLGQDKEDLDYLKEYCTYFTTCWEQQEKKALTDSINSQIQYIKSLQGTSVDILEALQKAEDQTIEQHIQQDSQYYHELKAKDEVEYLYVLDCLRLDKQKKILAQAEYMDPLKSLLQRRVIKFSGIFQAGFYLLNGHKNNINLRGTNVIDWLLVKKLFNNQFFAQLFAYTHKGQKKNRPHPWCMIQRIQRKLEEYDQETVDEYNISLGMLLKILTTSCSLRRQDVEIRKKKNEQIKKEIIQFKQEIEEIEELRISSLQQHLDGLDDDDKELFNEADWNQEFNSLNPKPIVPEEPQTEIDADIEDE